MTKVTINVSLTSGHSEGELYFLEGEGGKTVGIEHRFTFLPPRFVEQLSNCQSQERLGSAAQGRGSSRSFPSHRGLKDEPHHLVQASVLKKSLSFSLDKDVLLMFIL